MTLLAELAEDVESDDETNEDESHNEDRSRSDLETLRIVCPVPGDAGNTADPPALLAVRARDAPPPPPPPPVGRDMADGPAAARPPPPRGTF
eukprot:CAMPEP_0117042756 /NCGR_PEP_ID=MMETSP0472-20121206/29759_1 /TAXON_ID=693140 ORGANISM="Tiarina fusus, Strain LIS" /NCGR_SAMPLE_ID=MMETSP0472 /ASSEMBLY_ACC=CAM_ASM_000603 /LENGTH=91 /DNA_ID=CAMNT_0004754089 /DNA_START=48 /DNA_END=324 /DNA_ORIENTATION=+